MPQLRRDIKMKASQNTSSKPRRPSLPPPRLNGIDDATGNELNPQFGVQIIEGKFVREVVLRCVGLLGFLGRS